MQQLLCSGNALITTEVILEYVGLLVTTMVASTSYTNAVGRDLGTFFAPDELK